MAQVDTKHKVLVANRHELAVGLGKKVVIEGKELALFLQKDGVVYAIEDSCPHLGGPLSEGMVSGEHVFCPLHDWKISLKTGEAAGADEGCVARFDVEVENEQVYVVMPGSV
ncbi:nitrite reductase (NADH) small subunit [Geomicrobium halophilum]|uniref:Nitrite reductase (NADH) small subunit n=1 Tax=Geomicrobium halophilum TaxID=549000 RepID=A0A841PSE6_9BACL|nr:nitrite reductase small subunit NirD [Geomicrobium halophilum]MBB6450106.1 nitrite reductase (NADH) small subunit [Geomicrobium halophilum]